MQTQKYSGIILYIKPHGDFDRVIKVFSYEKGIVRVVAKGVRKIHSHRSFHIDLFNYVNMEVEQYAEHVNYLRELSTKNTFRGLKSNPEAFAAACIIASFLLRMIPERAPQRRLFTLTLNVITSATKQSSSIKKLLFIYFLKALRLLGYFPQKLPKQKLRLMLSRIMREHDPQFALYARRTLGIFSSL